MRKEYKRHENVKAKTERYFFEALKRHFSSKQLDRPSINGNIKLDFPQAATVIKLVRVAYAENDLRAGMLYVASYTFMLRVPSEALPMTAAENALMPLPPNTNSCISVAEDEVILRLERRKNKPNEAIIRRSCCCGKRKQLCPVHVLGHWMQAH